MSTVDKQDNDNLNTQDNSVVDPQDNNNSVVDTSSNINSFEGMPPCVMSEIVKDFSKDQLLDLIRSGSTATLNYVCSSYYTEPKQKRKLRIVDVTFVGMMGEVKNYLFEDPSEAFMAGIYYCANYYGIELLYAWDDEPMRCYYNSELTFDPTKYYTFDSNVNMSFVATPDPDARSVYFNDPDFLNGINCGICSDNNV